MDRPDQERTIDPVVAALMEGIDRTLIRENLRLTPQQRVDKMVAAAEPRNSAVRACACDRARGDRLQGEIRPYIRGAPPGLRRVISLDQLICAKRAAGRPKDLVALAELEAIRDERTR